MKDKLKVMVEALVKGLLARVKDGGMAWWKRLLLLLLAMLLAGAAALSSSSCSGVAEWLPRAAERVSYGVNPDGSRVIVILPSVPVRVVK